MISEEESSRLRFAKYAGKKMDHPERGSKVLVVEGDYAGEVFEVLAVKGHAFHPAYRVYVKGPDEETLWYWPWNLEIVEEPKKQTYAKK